MREVDTEVEETVGRDLEDHHGLVFFEGCGLGSGYMVQMGDTELQEGCPSPTFYPCKVVVRRLRKA